MPERAPLFPHEASPEAQEQILAPEDYARLDRLFLDTRRHTGIFIGSRNREDVALRSLWRDEGRKAAAYLLETLENRQNLEDMRSYEYTCLLDFCASPDDAQKIGELLLRDDVALAQDRSLQGRLLDTLERIGTPEIIDQLVQFADKYLDASYGADMKKQTNMRVLGILWNIGFRTDQIYADRDEDERYHQIHARLEDAGRTIKENLFEVIGEDITDEEEFAIAERVWSRDAESDFASLFEVQEPLPEQYDAYDTQDERNMYWEDEEDDAVGDDYREGKFAQIESRLETVKRLRHEIKKEQEMKEEPEDDDAKFLRRHWLEYREDHPSPYTPTLGIEIEIREKAVILPEEARDWSEDERSDFLYGWKKTEYERTEDLGVGKGLDAFWEFAHNPVRNYTTLSREVQALMEMGLINKDYHKHSLHITVGGVTSKGPGGKGAFILARALESTGWGATGGRIMRPYLLKRGAWTYKGQAGVKERDPDEIQLNMSCAIEIRTMQVQGLAGLDRLLRSCYLLGAALLAYQSEERGYPLFADTDPEMRETLTMIWLSFDQEAVKIFSKYGLSDPSTVWEVPDGYHEEGEAPTGDFVPFAALLDEARQHPQSRGAEFVAEMRGLIIATRKQVADIIYKKSPSFEAETSR